MRVDFTEDERKRLESFCSRRKLKVKGLLAKGHSSRIFLVQKGRKKLVAKVERTDSSRKHMLEREAFNLKLANSKHIGPRLLTYDFFYRILLMEYIKGETFKEWIFSKKRKKREVSLFVRELLKQGEKLDKLGLDHGQLAGRGVNILVRKGKPVIIDFEKASTRRKCHNRTVLEGFLFKNKNSAIAKRVKKLLR